MILLLKIVSQNGNYYNDDRPHSSLDGKTPIERLAELNDKTWIWEEVSAKFIPENERIQEQNYHADLALKKLKRCL